MEVQLLKDLLATAIEDNYDWDTIMPKFPELKDVDTQLLKDYAATAIEDNYDYSVINSKFPEFFGDSLKKKVVTTTTAYPLGQENTSTTLVTGNPNQEQGTPSVSLGSTEYKPSTIKDIGERPNETTINQITEKPYNINNMMEAASLKKIQQDWDKENAKNTLGTELSVDQQSGVEKIKEERQKDKELASKENLQSRIEKAEKIQSDIEKDALSKTRPTKESINPATGKVYGEDLIGEKELLRDQLLFDQQQDIAKIQSTKYDYLTPELFSQYEGSVAEFLNAREDLNKNFLFEETGFNPLNNSDFIKVSTVDKDGNKNGMREYTFEVDIDEGAEKNIDLLKVFLDRNRRASLEDRSRAQQEIVDITGQVVPSQRARLKENILKIDPLLGPTVTDATQVLLPPVTVPEWQLSLGKQDELLNARGVILSETARDEAELKATANIDKIKEKFKLTTRDNYSVKQFQEDLTNAENILMATSGSSAAALTNEINSSISTALNDNALQLKDVQKRNEQLSKDQESILLKVKNGEQVSESDIAKLEFDAAVLERDTEDLTMSDSELNVLMKDIEDTAADIALINKREGSKSGIITNNLIRGGGTFLRMLGADRTLVDKIVREASDPSTKGEYEKSRERTFTDKILATLSNMAGIVIPSAITGPMSAYVSAAGFMAQAKYQLRDEMDDNPDFNYMSDSKKDLISNLYGGVVGLLERYGLSKMISKSPLSKRATLVILRDVLQNLPKTVTTKTMTKAIQATTKRLVSNGGIQVLAAGGVEASTEVAQGGFEIGLKEVVNSMEGADLFKQDLSGQAIFENLFEAGALGFVAGGVTQGASQAASITKQGFKNSGLSEMISNSVLSLNRSKEFRSTMSNYFKTKILQGEITREEALKSLKAYDVMMGRANKIPSNIENITGAFDLITERANIESEIEGKDPALIVKQKERIKEINSELGALTEKAPVAEEVTETKDVTKEETELTEVEKGKTKLPLKDNLGKGDLKNLKSEYAFGKEGAVGVYVNEKTGSEDVFLVIPDKKSDKNYIGYKRVYDEQGNPTNEFSIKGEMSTAKPGTSKLSFEAVNKVLPEGSVLIETTNISTDGIIMFSNQMKNGYKPTGETFTVDVNTDGTKIDLGGTKSQGDFSKANFTEQELAEAETTVNDLIKDFPGAKIESRKITDDRFVKTPLYSIKVTLPKIQKPSQTEITTQEDPQQLLESVDDQGRSAKPGARLFNDPNPETSDISDKYKKEKGIETPAGEKITQLDINKSMEIADAYEAMKDNPNDPEVKEAYEALANETIDQYKSMTDAGYQIEIYEGKEEPYANSKEMIDDLINNKHMYIFSTEQGYGEAGITDQQRQENAMLADTEFVDKNGKPLLINDLFRGVHDFFGHSERGNGFGAKGEENAWDVHARMFTDKARRAMTAETRGQNSWVNFGPQMRDSKGNLLKKGDIGYKSAKERDFAPQKIGLLPKQYSEIIETSTTAPKVEAKPTVKAKNTEKQKTKIRKQVDRAKRSVRSVLKNVEFIVHESDADFVKATGSSDSGAFQRIGGKFNIHVNMDKANNRTVGHEVFHALLLSGGITDSQARKMTGSMLASVRKVASPEMLAKLDKFAAAYPEKLYNEESIAELFGIISEHYSELNDSGKSAIKEWLAKLVKALKLDKIINVNSSILEASNDEVIEFLDAVAKKVATGQEIVEGDVSILSEAKDDTAGIDIETRKRRQAEDLFLSDNKKKFNSLKDIASFIDSWTKENKLFDNDIKNIPDKEVVNEFAKHIELELKAWEKVRKDKYVSFYDNDIIEKTNPILQEYAKKEYGRLLTDTEVKLYHIVSAFASPNANPMLDSWKGFDIFDRFMKTGELSGYSDKIATVWDWTTTAKGKKVKKDTGVPRLDKDGNTSRSLMTMAYSQSGLDKFNTLIDKMGGDINKAIDWITSTHSHKEISDMFGYADKGTKALKQNEYMSKEDGGLGVFGMTGAKLGSYILNRFGNFSTVTKDMWYARTMARLAGEDLTTSKGDAIKVPWAESTVQGRRTRTLADKAFKAVADKLGTQPAMIQERIWDFEKRLYEMYGAIEDAAYTSDGLKKGIEMASKATISRQQKTGSAYFSNALEAVGNIKDTNPKQPVQWVKALTDPQKNGGVGGVNQELSWIGLEDYLTEWQKENKVKSVPQNIVEDYINDNQIEIVDVTLKKEVTNIDPTVGEDVIKVEVVEDNDGSYILQDQEGNRLSPDDKWSSKEEAEDDAIFLFPDYFHPYYFHPIGGIPSRPTTQNITNNTKYGAYTLDGGENYQEVLLTLPDEIPNLAEYNTTVVEYNNFFRDLGISKPTALERKTEKQLKDKLKSLKETLPLNKLKENSRTNFLSKKEPFESSHFDEENILAHVRINERTLPNGEKVMFIEEVQSDWAQEGKKKGFRDSSLLSEQKRVKQNLEEESKFRRETEEKLNKLKPEIGAREKFIKEFEDKSNDNLDKKRIDLENKLDQARNNREFEYWKKELDTVNNELKEKYPDSDFDQEEIDTFKTELADFVKEKKSLDETISILDSGREIDKKTEEELDRKVMSSAPDMPYKKTDQWVGLAIRRVMKMAADKGFDRIAWVTGEQSADRYDLSKQIDSISWDTTDFTFLAFDKNGDPVIDKSNVSEQDLESYVGKEVTQRLVESKENLTEEDEGVVELENQDLKIGGEGMKTFYNSIVPKVALAEAKRFDKKAKVDVISLPNSVFKEEVNPPTTKQLSIAITPEMNQKLEGGIGVTRQQKINWEVSEEGKGDPSISSRDDVVSRAAKKLKEGKISNKKWREIVNKRSPITPITRFFAPATLDRMKSALNVRQMPLINAVIEAGAKVGIRLDINAYKNKNTWVVSIHNNENNLGVAGKVISYRNVAKIKNVRFDSSEISTPRSALNIATGDKNKATIARIYGEWVNFDGKNSEGQAENAKKEAQDIVNSKEWVQIGMNPFRHSYFYDRSTVDKDGKIIGDPVKTADELLQIGGLVYAKNPTYGKWTDKEYIVQVKNKVTKEMQPLLDSEGDAIRFQKDGDKFVNQPTIEEIIRANPDSSVLDVNKELVRVGYSKEQIQKYREKEEGVYNPKTGSIKVDAIIKSVNSFRKRMLSARSLLPKSWYKFLEQKEANIAYHLRYSEKLAKLYNKEIGKYKGDKKELAEDFDAYLRGKRWRRKESNVLPKIYKSTTDRTEYFKNKVKGSEEIILPEKIQGVAVSMRNHVDALSQSLIDAGIVDGLSAENVQNNIGEYLTTSYKMYRADNWRDQVSDQVKQAAKNYIEQNNRSIIKDIAKEEGLSYTEAAKEYVDAEIEKILQKGEEGSFATKRGVSKDLSILKRKKDIDPAIENLMGIYNEPGLSYLETIMKVSALQAQHNYMSNIRKSGEGVFLFSRAKGKFTYKIASDTNDAMAPLNGLYTTKELKDELEASTKELSGFLKNYMKVVGVIKYGKTILSPATHAKNILGNLGFMFVNGHFNPVDWASAFNTLVRDSISLTESEYSRKMDEYIKVGVAGQSAGLGELKAMLSDATSKVSFEEAMIDRLSRKSLSVKQRIGKGIGKAGKFFENAYQAEDDLFKIIAYESEKARHLKVVAYEENKKVSELTDKEIERAKEMAAEKVKNTLPTYSRVPYIIQMARKSPLVGSFVAFHAESFRTAANTAVISIQELTSSNPELRMIGAKRIAGTGAYLAAKAGILSAYSWGAGAGIGLMGGLFDDDDEIQIQKDIARFLPSYSKDSDILITSIKPGEVKYIDTSASDPHGSIAKMLNAFLRSDTTIEGIINSARAFLDPILGLEIATEAVQNLFNNQDVYGRRIYDETDTAPDIIYDVSLFIAKVIEPGGLTSARRIIRADDPRSEIIGATTGYREREIELKNDGRWLIIEKVEAISESMKSYNSIFNKYERNILSKYEGQKVSEKDIVTKEMVIKEYKEANGKVRALQKELIEIWNSLDRLGMTPINKLQLQQSKLFSNSGISKENIQNIGNNKIYDIKPKEGEGGIGDDIDYGDIIIGEPIIKKY